MVPVNVLDLYYIHWYKYLLVGRVCVATDSMDERTLGIFVRKTNRAGEMAQLVKMPAVNSDDPNLIPRPHMVA